MARSVGKTAATRGSRPRIASGSWRGGGAPGGGVLADHFVGVLALGETHDAHVREAAAVGGALDLADERRQLGGPDRAGPRPGGIDVVGERDPGGVARGQLPRARRERRAQAADDGLEAVLVGHQGVRVALDDDRLLRLAHGALGAVDEVERAALVEDERGRGVEVLRAAVRALALRAEDTAAEPAPGPRGAPGGGEGT